MRRMNNRRLSLLLVFLLVFGVLSSIPAMTLGADYSVGDGGAYEYFYQAVYEKPSGSSFILLSDVTDDIGEPSSIGYDCSVDLNGFKLTLDAANLAESDALTISDGRVEIFNNAESVDSFLYTIGYSGIALNDATLSLSGRVTIDAHGVSGPGLSISGDSLIEFTGLDQILNVNNAGPDYLVIPLSMPESGFVWENTGGSFDEFSDETSANPFYLVAYGDIATIMLAISPSAIVEADKAWLTWDVIRDLNLYQDWVTTNLILPEKGPNGSDVSWSSANSAVDPLTGEVTRPAVGESDESGVLTAILSKGDVTDTVTFDLIVKARPKSDSGFGGSGGGGGSTVFSVRFESNGGSAVSSVSVVAGLKLAKPLDPIKASYLFDGWYTDATLTTAYDFNKAVSSSFILYAKWKPFFADVPLNAWYAPAVAYVSGKGVMVGTDAEARLFGPDIVLTRAMVTAILHRLAGSPDTRGYTSPFDDVTEDTWYGAVVSWAAAKGYAKGYGDGNFGPEDLVTVEQLAAFMSRYFNIDAMKAKKPQVKAFDKVVANDWADLVVKDFHKAGLFNDIPWATLDATQPAPRSVAASVLYRLLLADDTK